MKLTIKQAKFAKDVVSHGNAAKAAYENYNVKDKKSAALLGYRNMKKPAVKEEIERLMNKGEITPELLVERLKEGLDATVVANYKGKAVETDVPDQNVRHKFFQEGARIMELYPVQKTENKNLNVNVDMELEKMSKEDMNKLLREALNE